jgi:hypothetical protein
MSTDQADVTWHVSEDVRRVMVRHGDGPATDEVYHGVGSQYSETFGRSGKRYVWVRSTLSVHVYLPLDEPAAPKRSRSR